MLPIPIGISKGCRRAEEQKCRGRERKLDHIVFVAGDGLSRAEEFAVVFLSRKKKNFCRDKYLDILLS